MSTEKVNPTTNVSNEELLEILKFTPRTYRVSVWGYGGEYVMGRVDRKIYDYFKSRRLDFAAYATDWDFSNENDIPEDMMPFEAGSWHDCDGITHVNGADISAGTIEISDENDNPIYTRELESITDDGVGFESDDENYVHHLIGKDDAIFVGVSSEKGTFFEGEIELTAPFDIKKLTIHIEDVDGAEIMSGITYDGQDIDCLDMSTNGKGYDMRMYTLNNAGEMESYYDMDSIEYPLTEWFPKKVKPVRKGRYNVKTTGKNTWTIVAEWTGEKWESVYGDEEVKVKEWQGISVDPETI